MPGQHFDVVENDDQRSVHHKTLNASKYNLTQISDKYNLMLEPASGTCESRPVPRRLAHNIALALHVQKLSIIKVNSVQVKSWSSTTMLFSLNKHRSRMKTSSAIGLWWFNTTQIKAFIQFTFNEILLEGSESLWTCVNLMYITNVYLC